MIAIVIPYFKVKYFEETLKSLTNQTNRRFNLYIGNDNSPEDPEELISIYKKKIDFTYIKFNENLGQDSLTAHWDRCIEMTNDEDWIMILGDDDYVSENYIESFYSFEQEIKSNKINVVRFATIVVNEITGQKSNPYFHPKIQKSTDSFYNKYFKSSRGSLSEHIFTRDSYKKFGFRNFKLAWGSDTMAWLEFTQFGNIYTINEAIAYFRISPDNISRKGYKEKIKDKANFIYFKIIVDQFLNNFTSSQRLRILRHYEHLARISGNLSLLFFSRMIMSFWIEGDYMEVIKFSRRMIYYKTKI